MTEPEQVLKALYRKCAGTAGRYANLGELAKAVRWDGLKLGIIMHTLVASGDVQVQDDMVALTFSGLARARSIAHGDG